MVLKWFQSWISAIHVYILPIVYVNYLLDEKTATEVRRKHGRISKAKMIAYKFTICHLVKIKEYPNLTWDNIVGRTTTIQVLFPMVTPIISYRSPFQHTEQKQFNSDLLGSYIKKSIYFSRMLMWRAIKFESVLLKWDRQQSVYSTS